LDERIAYDKELYLDRTTQHRKNNTNTHALSGIRSHDLSVHAMKAFTSDRATWTGNKF
jgi:hypothetical protein